MTLVANWRAVIRRAWSLRFIALAFLFSLAEVALPAFDGALPIPPRSFALICAFASAGAFVARIVAQNSLPEDDDARP